MEVDRRARLYDSLVRAQRRYAAKLSTAEGPQGYFTTEQWNTLGEEFAIEEWEAGFVVENPCNTRREVKRENVKKEVVKKEVMKKENLPVRKGKEKEIELDSDDDDVATLTMVF
jgi:hypothetical protein